MSDIIIYKANYQYGTLSTFLESLISAYEKMGYSVAFVDLTKPGFIEHLKEELATPKKFIFSLSGIGHDLKVGDKNLYDILPYPLIEMIADHPARFLERYNIENAIITCIDRSHVKFLRDYYGESKKVAFVPHGGCFAKTEPAEKERNIDILFAVTYIDPNMLLDEIKAFEEIPRRLALETAERVLDGNYITCEEAAFEVAKKYGIDMNNKDFLRKLYRETIAKVENYTRTVKRCRLFEMLDKSGLNILVYGKDWPAGVYKNLNPQPPITFHEILNLTKKTKISINACCFPDGSHERVFSAMLNGAASVSDYNPYFAENFTDMENIIFYKWMELDSLPEKITYALSGDRWMKIAEAGQKLALEKHTWDVRALELLKIAENFRR